MRRAIWVALFPLGLLAGAAWCQEPSQNDLQARLQVLESETEQMREEVQRLRSTPTRLPAIETVDGEIGAEGTMPATSEVATEYLADAPDTGLSWKSLQADMKKLTWTKGDFTITPYGYVSVSGIYESERTAMGDYALYVLPPQTAGEPASYVDAKSTRLGLNILGPEVCWFPGAKVDGRVEIDFQGPYINANQGSVLFRQGYVEVKNDEYLVLVGQTWEILSSLYPGMLQWVPASGAGNLGYRRAMVRGDRYLDFSDTFLWTLQGSLNANVITDFKNDPTVTGRPSGWPIVEFRSLFTLGERKGPDALPVLLAFSGHIGEQEFSFITSPWTGIEREVVRTWSVNLELSIPITKKIGFQSEVFHGADLGTFMGGALQGVDRLTGEPIQSTGGWVDVYYNWTPSVHSHLGYCLDDPLNSDLTSGRTYNQVIFGNVLWDVTKSVFLGLEVSQWTTNWMNYSDGQGNSTRCEFLAKYVF